MPHRATRPTTDAPLTKLADLAAGEAGEFFAVLAGRERGTTRDGRPYYRVAFRDARRTATAMVWHDSPCFDDCDGAWKKGGFFRLRGRFGETKYGPQIEIDEVRPICDADAADGFDPADFFTAPRGDAAEQFRAIVRLAEERVADLPLRRLVVELLTEHEDRLTRLPGAARNHHAYPGGFVGHVLAVARTAAFLADEYAGRYPRLGLSKDLVVAGAVLHDVGKLVELDPVSDGSEPTPPGRLIGHVLLGRDLVRDKARSIDGLDAETLLRLEHLIVSHHDTADMGSPVPPMTPEALIVHHADTLDAKVDMMAAALATPGLDGELFTGRDNPLRRPIFRGLRPDGR